jgi:hypothetical protein
MIIRRTPRQRRALWAAAVLVLLGYLLLRGEGIPHYADLLLVLLGLL